MPQICDSCYGVYVTNMPFRARNKGYRELGLNSPGAPLNFGWALKVVMVSICTPHTPHLQAAFENALGLPEKKTLNFEPCHYK